MNTTCFHTNKKYNILVFDSNGNAQRMLSKEHNYISSFIRCFQSNICVTIRSNLNVSLQCFKKRF